MADLYRYSHQWDNNPDFIEAVGEETVKRLRHDQLVEERWMNLPFPKKIAECGIAPTEIKSSIKLALDAAVIFPSAWPGDLCVFDIHRWRISDEGYFDKMYEKPHPITKRKVMYFSCPDNDTTVLNIQRLLKAILEKQSDTTETDEDLQSFCEDMKFPITQLGSLLKLSYESGDSEDFSRAYKFVFSHCLNILLEKYKGLLRHLGLDLRESRDELKESGVFISYAREDVAAAKGIFTALTESGLRPWLDLECLVPGEDWELSIRTAIRNAKYVVVCLSRKSIEKRGFFQKEMKTAISTLDEIPEKERYLIPIRLDECDVPQRLQHLQWVNLFEEGGFKKLLKSLGK